MNEHDHECYSVEGASAVARPSGSPRTRTQVCPDDRELDLWCSHGPLQSVSWATGDSSFTSYCLGEHQHPGTPQRPHRRCCGARQVTTQKAPVGTLLWTQAHQVRRRARSARRWWCTTEVADTRAAETAESSGPKACPLRPVGATMKAKTRRESETRAEARAACSRA